MLKKVKIERFKSVHDTELEFGRVNLLIGGNGSGKSNVLEAIGVLAAALSRGVSDVELSRKGVRLTPPALMKSAFKGVLPRTLRLAADFENNISYALELTASDVSTNLSFFSESAQMNGRRFFGRGKNGSTVFGSRLKREPERGRGLWDQIRISYDFDEMVVREFDKLNRFAIYAPQTEFLREIKSGSVSDPPIGLHGEGLAQAVSGLIAQGSRAAAHSRQSKSAIDIAAYEQLRDALLLAALPGWTSIVKVGLVDPLLRSRDVSSAEGNIVYFIDKYMHKKRQTLSAYDSSEGTLFLLFVGVLLGHSQAPKIFALDNVDSALNPSLTRKLIERIVAMVKRRIEYGIDEGPDQVFMTSHNPTALDAFDLTDPDQAVFIVSRDLKGHTMVERLKLRDGISKEDWLQHTKGRKLSQMWIDGDIVGALGQSGNAI
ncbi:MAG: AAA family ATPase [Aliidongia sp.]